MKVIKIRGVWKREDAEFEDLKRVFPTLTVLEFEKSFGKKVIKIEEPEKAVKNEKTKTSPKHKKHTNNSVSKTDRK